MRGSSPTALYGERVAPAIRLAVAAAAVVGVLAGPPAAPAASLTFAPTADAYVDESQPTVAFGASTVLAAAGAPRRRTLLRFTVSGLAGRAVARATLRLYCTNGSSAGGSVHRVASTTWDEGTVDFVDAPVADAAELARLGPVLRGGSYALDVSALVTGDGTYSLELQTASGDGAFYAARESATGAPQLVVATVPLRVGAYWYGWYGSNGRHWLDGFVRDRLATPQAPLLGRYDSRDPATLAAQLGWAQRYGIDFLISSWWGPGSYEDVSTRDHLLASPALGRTKVAVLYESLALLPRSGGLIDFDVPGVADKLLADVDYLARTVFPNPGYERIDGRPVIYLYVSRIWRGNYAAAIATLRATIRQRYGYDPYLVGDEVDWDGTPTPDRIRLFDAITAYTMYSGRQTPGWPDDTGFLAGVRDRYARFKAVADSYGVHFIPNALPGFDDRGVRLAVDHYVLPHELGPGLTGSYTLFARFLDLDADFLDPARPTLTVTSFNEWHEDTQIEPTAAAAASSLPVLYTQGYPFAAYGTRLLATLYGFRAAHPG
jgi:hypothetical protein